MSEPPSQAVRGKRHSSIRVGVEHHKAGNADAFISAGNTGAVMAASRLVLGLHPGVDRPAIAWQAEHCHHSKGRLRGRGLRCSCFRR